MRIVIINPTYNEKDNIKLLIKKIAKVRDEQRIKGNDIYQLVVDDYSPDGTSEVVNKLSKEYTFVSLINGKKEGLGKAYIRGMRYAMKEMNADIVIMMDADLQHDPRLIPSFLNCINEGYDFVIGSRYIKGGSYPKEWGKFRILNSTIANILARYIAGLHKVKDCTSGYRAIRVKGFLDKVDFKYILADGYSFQLMILANLMNKKAKVYEIPMDFKERYKGLSKVGMNSTYIRDILEFFRNAFIIRIYNSRVLLKFLLVGGTGTVVNLVVYRSLYTYSHNLFFNELLAGEVSIIFNFIFNHNWTFKSSTVSWGKALLKYNLVSVISIIISSSTVGILGRVYGSSPHIWYAVVGIALGTIWTFTLSSKLIWSKKEENNVKKDQY